MFFNDRYAVLGTLNLSVSVSRRAHSALLTTSKKNILKCNSLIVDLNRQTGIIHNPNIEVRASQK